MNIPSHNEHWVLASHPDGAVRVDDFRMERLPLKKLEDGEFLVAVEYVAIEPAMRTWLTGQDSYVPGIQVGELIRGSGIGTVAQSRNPEFVEGSRVMGGLGWQRYAIFSGVEPIPPQQLPSDVDPAWSLSVLGLNGLAAYFGLLEVGQPVAGQTVLVSGAAGATGSIVAQIAKLKGCHVIGVAGGVEKTKWLTETAGLDGAIDYKDKSVSLGDRVRELCPNGIDVFFDNVGGEILDVALANIALRGRVVVCGAISHYNATESAPGPSNYINLIVQRARMEGFMVFDYLDRITTATTELSKWLRQGKLTFEIDVQEGFERAPEAFLRLFSGKNLGKQLLKL